MAPQRVDELGSLTNVHRWKADTKIYVNISEKLHIFVLSKRLMADDLSRCQSQKGVMQRRENGYAWRV